MQIQQDNFIQKLLSLEKGRAYIPDLRKKRTWYLKKLTDAKLVKYIRRGNNHAFDVLIKRHEVKLKYILRVNLFDKSMVDDVAQDVWEKVVNHLRSRDYKENGKFYGWLSTLAFRKTIDVNRQKKYNPEFISYDPAFHDLADSSEDYNEPNEVVEEAKKIILTFNEREQQIMKMHYEEGLTFEKIAGKMQIKGNTLKSLHLRSVNKIRRGLKIR